MRTAYIIYQPDEEERNRAFIRMFQEKGRSEGFAFSSVTVQKYQEMPLPALVLNRTRQPEVSRWYEERGVYCLHDSRFVRLANHKYLTLTCLRDALPPKVLRQKWCPKTRLLRAEEVEQAMESGELWEQERVIKSVHGHGGSEVFLTSEPMERLAALRGQDCILQERIASASQDIRVYLLGGEIYQAVLRTGAEGDFRSNYSQGGSAEIYSLSQAQQQYVACFIRAVQSSFGAIGMAGIDFILSEDGCLIFNEIEEMVGCRMLYGCSDRDIVADYIHFLDIWWNNVHTVKRFEVSLTYGGTMRKWREK